MFEKIKFYCLVYRFATMVGLKLVLDLIRKPTLLQIKPRLIPPACLNNYGTHGYVQLSKVKIHYVEAGDRARPLMLFVHGFPDFWFSWRHQLKEFSKDYWCVAIDMRGYGDSDKPESLDDYAMDALVEDLKEIVQKLERTKFILIAHDWGGVVAWEFVAKHNDMLDKYVIMNAPERNAYRKLVKTDAAQFRKSWYVFFFQAPYIPELIMRQNDMEIFEHKNMSHVRKRNDEELEAYKYTFGKKGAFTPPINYYRKMFGKNSPTTSFTHVTARGLFIFGTNDTAISVKIVAAIEEIVPRVKTVMIHGANHFVNEDAPRDVNREIRQFLSESKL